MPENKFDLNKALQAAKLYNKIDYGNLYVPDVQQTTNNFENWRKSQGYKTEEEKQEDLKAEMQADQQRFNEQGLWNSEDPYEVYNAYQTDPEKQAEFQRNGEMVAGIGSTVATLPFTAGMMGWIPAITTTATGAAGGYAGAYGGQKLGQYLDNKYGWNTTPYLSTAGGLVGGILGGGLGYKGTVQLGSRGWLPKNNAAGNLYNKQFVTDVVSDALNRNVRQTTLPTQPLLNVGWAPAQTMNVRRAGDLTVMYYPERWDAVHEGANPFGVWLQGKFGTPRTDITNPGKGAKAAKARKLFENRPQYVGDVTFKKPIGVIGDVADRSALSYNAERMGADGIIYNGYYDNGYNNNQGMFSFVKPNLSPSSGKPARIMWMGPTAGKTTYAKKNLSVVDIDPLTKGTRKVVARDLGLDFRDPRVSESPEYRQAIVDMVNKWLKDPTNHGKTLVASTKHLLDPKYKINFANEPFMPDFKTFVARNQARGFRETPEQLRKWYDSILEIKPDIKIDNRFTSEILNGQ